MPAEQPTCATCRWWNGTDAHREVASKGQFAQADCRVRAPMGLVRWATTEGTDWCGEHAPVATSPRVEESPDAR